MDHRERLQAKSNRHGGIRVYPVSAKYIELMDQDILNAQISMTMDLIRLDMDIQRNRHR